MKTRFLSMFDGRVLRAGCQAAILALALVATGSAAGAPLPAWLSGGESASSGRAYAMELTALGSSTATDLSIQIRPRSGQANPTALTAVVIRTRPAHASKFGIRILRDISITEGVAAIDLRPLPHGTNVVVDVLFHAGTSKRIHILHESTPVRLRPDLVVALISAPGQTLTGRPVDVVAEITELNGDMGADATVTLRWGPSLVATQPVSVQAGGRSVVTFSGIALPDAVLVGLTVDLSEVTTPEFDATNNARSVTVDVTEHELVPSWQVLPSLGGYGAQFNQHVYASVTPKPDGSLPGLEEKVKALEPQLVRIFFHEVQERTAEQMASFVETVELAQQAGATINITYQTATNAKSQPEKYMGDFAAVLDDLVRTRQFTNVRWVTIQNEPNTTAVTQTQYNALYRALHAELVNRDLRDQIGLMGGDLVESSSVAGSNHRLWFQYMAQNMNDILDAYSVHIYWNYWDIPRMEYRLKSVRQIVTEELPPEARKPVYVTEFGVRGIQNITGLPVIAPGYWQDGTPLSRTNIAAFQQLQFNVLATQLGYAGTVKWDAYWGRYTAGYREVYNLIGPAEEGWPLFPSYHAFLLQLQTTQRGWQVLGVAPWADDDWKLSESGQANDQPEKEITAYSSPDGQLTLIGLDTHARDLNAASAEPPGSYSIGGLPPATAFTLVIWNATGDGTNSIAGSVTSSAAGVARFTVPQHAAFALTTVPVS